jgi:hypothetical protein
MVCCAVEEEEMEMEMEKEKEKEEGLLTSQPPRI